MMVVKHPLDQFPLSFEQAKLNKRISNLVGILCLFFGLHILISSVVVMNTGDLNLDAQAKFHFPVFEHSWAFYVRSVLTKAVDISIILFLIFSLLAVASYKDILESCESEVKKLSWINKVTLFAHHYILNLYCMVMRVLKYAIIGAVIGFLAGWAIQLYDPNMFL